MEERSNLRNRRPRDGMTMTSTPRTINCPFRLIIYAGGGPSAVGELTSHCRREAEISCGSLDKRNAGRRSTGRFWWKRWKCSCLSKSFRCGRKTGVSTRISSRSGNHGCCVQNEATTVSSNPRDCLTLART